MKISVFSTKASSQQGKPVLAKDHIPEWYRKGETYYYISDCSDPSCEEIHNQEKKSGLKTCIPVFDAITSGYFLVTPIDIYVGFDDENKLNLKWNAPDDYADFVMERPDKSGKTIPRPAGHLNNHLVWSGQWGIKTPRNYSLIVTHPLNRFDLPFTTMSAIMDSDKVFIGGNMPFFIKEGFTGLIPEGTPYAQLIPIKRKKWNMIVNNQRKDLMHIQDANIASEEKHYKKRLWQKKEYS